MNETVRKSVRIHLRFIMTKVINRKRGKGDKHFSRCLQHSCFLFHGTEEVIDDAQDPFEKWTVLTLMALTIVPVKVTMLDPFNHAWT